MPELLKALGEFLAQIFPRSAYDQDPASLPMNQETTPEPQNPAPAVPVASIPDPDTLGPWDASVEGNMHNVRVLCDLAGLPFKGKQIITACVDIESGFQNHWLSGPLKGQPVTHKNLNKDGSVASTDWGIVQINDGPKNKHICTQGCDFPSVQYVLDNPDKAVRYMIAMYKAGHISLWASYTNLMAGVYPEIAEKYGIGA